MEAFNTFSDIRKIPICRHIFHDECLMKWFGGSQQMDAQKCPMCNIDVTPDAIEKAILDDANAKAGNVLAMLGNSPKKPQ